MSTISNASNASNGLNASNQLPQRFGRNSGAYLGETIEIAPVLAEIESLARAAGWRSDPMPTDDGLVLQGWVREATRPGAGNAVARYYVSAGIHGDEPAGLLAMHQLIRDDRWPDDASIWLCPCLNPTGFALNRRENARGFDLNRQYLHLEAGEVRAHVAWLQRQPMFDRAICLHEDWESHGFYLYELNPDGRPSQAHAIIREVSMFCPIDLSMEIEGRPARDGIIYPNVDPASRPQWPEAFFLLMHKTRHTYTIEAPSDFDLSLRVRALVHAVRVATAIT